MKTKLKRAAKPVQRGPERMIVRSLLDMKGMVSLQVEERVGRLRVKGTFYSTMIYAATSDRVRDALVASLGAADEGIAAPGTRSTYVMICPTYGLSAGDSEVAMPTIRLRYLDGRAEDLFRMAVDAISRA